jgi:hypothetical protein
MLLTLMSCQAVRLNKECKITLPEVRANWDVTALTKWNYSCFEFLDRIYHNQNCFVGMDTVMVYKLFGNKHTIEPYQGKWRVLYSVANPNVDVNEMHYFLAFIINDGKVELVTYLELSRGNIVN